MILFYGTKKEEIKGVGNEGENMRNSIEFLWLMVFVLFVVYLIVSVLSHRDIDCCMCGVYNPNRPCCDCRGPHSEACHAKGWDMSCYECNLSIEVENVCG
jgi:hypothetical protein